MTQEDNYGSRTRRALARLIFERDLEGSHWFAPVNRESIDRRVHYGNECFVSQSKLTLGGLLDSHPEYVSDTCTKILSAQKTMTNEEFLASLLEKLLSDKGTDDGLKLSQYLAQLDDKESRKFNEIIREYLGMRQIPAENLYVAFGIYTLQKAQDQGVVSLADGKVTLQQ